MNSSSESGSSAFHHITLQVILILGIGVIAWSNSFSTPFVFDDLTTIVNNQQIRYLHRYFTDPSLFLSEPRRFLGYLSFALNYRFNGLFSAGYHAVNLALHIGSALCLFSLCRVLFRSDSQSQFSGPLAAAMLFIAHPVQTQAVTYVTQRFTLLATFFAILTLLCYATARQKETSGTTPAWYAASFITAVCAMFSKEIAFSLPVAVIMLEFCLFPGQLSKRLLLTAPFMALFLIPIITLSPATDPELLMLKGIAATGVPAHAHEEYLFTQPAVFSTYLRLLILPVNQTLDYDYPLYRSIAEPEVAGGLLLLLALALLALRLCRLNNRNSRLAGFGILWFILSLSVEAAVPLADVINEHRLYLPSAGAAISVSAFLQMLSTRINPRLINIALLTAVLILAGATWKRNLVWSDELLLWSDAASKAPGKARPHYNSGTILSRRGLAEAAEREFLAALAIEPDHARARYNLGVLKGARGDTVGARADYEAALRIDPSLAEAHNSMGALLSSEGRIEEAMGYFREALRISPLFADARNNLGAALAIKGDMNAAVKEFDEAVRLDPQNRTYRENLERVLNQR